MTSRKNALFFCHFSQSAKASWNKCILRRFDLKSPRKGQTALRRRKQELRHKQTPVPIRRIVLIKRRNQAKADTRYAFQ